MAASTKTPSPTKAASVASLLFVVDDVHRLGICIIANNYLGPVVLYVDDVRLETIRR